MPDFGNVVEDLRRARDEIRLKIHLGSKDLQDQWADLETRWKRFEARAQLGRTAEDVTDAVRILGSELKEGYERLRKAL